MFGLNMAPSCKSVGLPHIKKRKEKLMFFATQLQKVKRSAGFNMAP